MIRFTDDHVTGTQSHKVSLKGHFHCKMSYFIYLVLKKTSYTALT